ncbi:MAG: hypothetical protein B7X42_08930, partial [Thiomonas sp. 14-66-4]
SMPTGKHGPIQVHLVGAEQLRTQGRFVFETAAQNRLASNTASQLGQVEPRDGRTNFQWMLGMREEVTTRCWAALRAVIGPDRSIFVQS